MTDEEKYKVKISELDEKLEKFTKDIQDEKVNIGNKYLDKIRRFDDGDFIYNVTGIIKVCGIEYLRNAPSYPPTVSYYGVRYWKSKGELKQTKTTYGQKYGTLRDYRGNLKKINNIRYENGKIYYK